MFVIQFVNPTTGDWAFQVKGVYQNLDKVDLFDKDSCFATREEAEEHIQYTLKHPDCGRWQEYVDASCFKIVEVYPIPQLPTAYSTKNHERNINMDYNLQKDGAVVAIRLFVGENGLSPMAEIKCYARPDTITVQWDVVANREAFSPGITSYTLWYDERPKRDFKDW